MKDPPLYLRSNVVVEPLVDQWYAWSHLIAPATAAMNISERHLKIMESYVDAPHLHAAAVKTLSMLGGPFVDYGGQRVAEIRDLLEDTRGKRASMIDFASALRELSCLLLREATGYALDSLYAKVPACLQGYVELVYDLNHQPSFRLMEPLLYLSPYYDPTAQSFMLSLISQDARPFVLSTPRLESSASIHLRLPFNSEAIDTLFRMKRIPQVFSHTQEMLGAKPEDDALLRTLLTEQAPEPYRRYTGDGLRWRYFGHACILLETRDTTILLDPVLSYTYESDISRYTYQDLPDSIDYVLITHNHQDHILFETMLQLRHKIKQVVVPRSGGGALQDPSLKLLLRRIGFHNVIELEALEELPFLGGSIQGIPFLGEHADLDIPSKLAYLVRLYDRSVLFAADSCNLEPRLYHLIQDAVGDIDTLFLGMECDGAPLTWVYGPLLTQPLDRRKDRSRRLAGSNFERARQMVDALHCRELYVYAMGQEPWLRYIMSLQYTDESNAIIASNQLLQYYRSQGKVAERLFGEREIFLDL